MPDTSNTSTTSTIIVSPNYFAVTLNRLVTLNNFDYKPGLNHVVDQPTLDQMGDAVVTSEPYGPFI